MKLERHVGGLSQSRKVSYLVRRGWEQASSGWACLRLGIDCLPLKKAIHYQLTEDLSKALVASGWKVLGYSQRGYVQLQDPVGHRSRSLPAALRAQARREGRLVGEFTYGLFLAAVLQAGASG